VAGETVGEAIRRWRRHRGLSLRQLGNLLNYSHVYVWEIEKGVKPATHQFVAECDRRLNAGGQLLAIAARHSSAESETREPQLDLGLDIPAQWPGGVEAMTALWRHDAGRRRFLQDTAYLASGFAIPVQRWIDAALDDSAEPAGPFRAGEGAPVEAVRAATSMFRRLDNLYGGVQIRPALVRFLNAEVAPLLQDGPPERLGRELLTAVAEAVQLAGWLAYDTCEHGVAQRYLVQALQLAARAQDRPLGAEILAAMSHQAIFLGHNGAAIELAQAAHRTAARAEVPALAAEASIMTAHAYAQLGDEASSTQALTDAEAAFDRADRAHDPHWMSYFDEAYLAAISGHCFRALGRHRHAERCARRSLDMNAGYQRGRLFNQLLLARAHALARQVDQACAAGHDALDLAEQMSSARAVAHVERLLGDLMPWRHEPMVKGLTERARLVAVPL
jgi:Helix-turn-helix domain